MRLFWRQRHRKSRREIWVQYNYDFEIASLLIMIIILLHFCIRAPVSGEKTRVFGWLLFVCEAECLMNILSCVGLANAALVPQRLNEVLAFAFFVLEGLLPIWFTGILWRHVRSGRQGRERYLRLPA